MRRCARIAADPDAWVSQQRSLQSPWLRIVILDGGSRYAPREYPREIGVDIVRRLFSLRAVAQQGIRRAWPSRTASYCR